MMITGIDHIELTVKDLEVSKRFYEKLPGFKVVASYLHFIMFSCSNFKLGITDHKKQTISEKFNEKIIGMDHVSFRLSKKEDLNEAVVFFEKENIKHGDIRQLSNDAYVLAFRDPDNIQLEFSWKEAIKL